MDANGNDNSTTIEEVHSDPVVIAWTRNFLFPLNLFVILVQLPLSLFNFLLISRTSLLHQNLKNLLFAQCACFVGFGLAHFVQICIIFNILAEVNPARQEELIEAKEHTHPIILFTVQVGNLIGHALLVERCLATIWAHRYEQMKWFYFTLGWFIPMFSFALYSCLQQISLHSDLENPISVFHLTQGSIISSFISLLLSFAEILVFSIVGAKNLERYKSWLNTNQNQHNLSERYQLSENVRTARQLAPTMIYHFVNIVFSSILPILIAYKLLHDDVLMDLIMIISLLSQSICNALIEYTVISRHPALSREALNILRVVGKMLLQPFQPPQNRVCVNNTITTETHKEGNCNSNHNNNNNNNDTVHVQAIATAIGTSVTVGGSDSETDKYFTLLQKQWG